MLLGSTASGRMRKEQPAPARRRRNAHPARAGRQAGEHDGEAWDWRPLCQVEGSLQDAGGLRPLDALFSSCLRFMLDADPVDDVAQLTMRQIERKYPKAVPLPDPTPYARNLLAPWSVDHPTPPTA